MEWPIDLVVPKGVEVIVGIDEAGRGAWAGPLSLGLFEINTKERFLLDKMNLADSKKVEKKQREDIFYSLKLNKQIKTQSTLIGSKTIDRFGLTKSYHIALTRLLKKYDPLNTLVLADYGIKVPSIFSHQFNYVRGDALVPVIAGASIIAKVRRDRYMSGTLHLKFPQYQFAKNVGYGTKQHKQAIKKHGLTSFHRHSWSLSGI